MSLPRRRFSNAARERSGIERVEPRVYRKHQQWVRGHRCVVCDVYGHQNIGAGAVRFCHVRIGTDGGTNLKPSDIYGNPICDGHHLEQHDIGERTFEQKYPRAFPKGLKARALEFARQSPVPEVRERAARESA